MRRAWLCLLAGCGMSADPGLDALVRVEGAQYVPGALPSPSGGPAVAQAFLPNLFVHAGERGLPLDGTLEPGGNGAAIGLVGDAGYWIVPSGTPDTFDPTRPTLSADVDFARLLPAGDRALDVIALDRDGHAGDAFEVPITVDVPDVPDGSLVFTLRWDSPTDLDLHVITPDGIEVWSRNVNSYDPPAPGHPPDPPDAWKSGGILDQDSNARCVIDGIDREDVVWTIDPPPGGTYVVRVDAFSLCGEASANWVVEARVAGEVVATASGLALPQDAELPHEAGAGVHALDVDVP